MALLPIAPSAPSETYSRINAAIALVNQVLDALQQESKDRLTGDTAEGVVREALNGDMLARTNSLRTDLTAEGATREALNGDMLARTNSLRIDLTAEGATREALNGDMLERTNSLRTDLTAERTQRSQVDTALQSAITGERAERVQGITDQAAQLAARVGELRALIAGKAGLDDLQAALAALQFNLTAQRMEFTGGLGRPGDTPSVATFVTSLDQLSGPGGTLPLVPDGLVTFGDNGATMRMRGPGIVASRQATAIERGRVYRARTLFQRRANAADPANDAVVYGVIWLDQVHNLLTGADRATIIRDARGLTVSDGPQEVQTTLARARGSDILIKAPTRARYFRTFVQSFGADALTDVEILEHDDITAGLVLPPLSADTVARVGALEGQSLDPRLTAIEQQISTPHRLGFETRGDAVSGTIPDSVTTVDLAGILFPGDGQGGLFQRVSGALPSGADGFTNDTGGNFLRVATASDVYFLPDQTVGGLDQDKLTAAVTYCRTSGRTLLIHRPYAMTSNTLFDVPVTFGPRGMLTKAVGASGSPYMLFSDDLTAGARQVFDRALTVDLSTAKCEFAAYEWWGAVGTRNPGNAASLPDSAAAINAAWASGHNQVRGLKQSYRHADTLYATRSKVTYGPPIGFPLCEMWFDDPSGVKDAIVVNDATGGSIQSPVLGANFLGRMQAATAGSAINLIGAVQSQVGGRVYNSLTDKHWWNGITVGNRCQDVDLRQLEDLQGCRNYGIGGSISLPSNRVIGVYLPEAYIRDCAANVSFYGYFEGVFSFPATLNFNGLAVNYSFACPSPNDANVIKLEGGDNDTGVLGYYCQNVGAIMTTQWVSNIVKCGIFKDCPGLTVEARHLYPMGSGEGLEFQGCTGSVFIKVASGGLYAVRHRGSDVTGKGNKMTCRIEYASGQSFGVIENSLPPGFGAKFAVPYVGYDSVAAVTSAPDPSGTYTPIYLSQSFT